MRPLIIPMFVICLVSGCVSSERFQFARTDTEKAPLAPKFAPRARAGARLDRPAPQPETPRTASTPTTNSPLARVVNMGDVDAAALVPRGPNSLADVMSRLRQEGVVYSQAASTGMEAGGLTATPHPPTQRAAVPVAAPLAAAVRNLPTPLAAHVSHTVAGTEHATVSQDRLNKAPQTTQQIASYDSATLAETSDFPTSFETTGIGILPVDTSISINRLSSDVGAAQIALVNHTAPVAAENIKRLPSPTTERSSTDQVSLAIFQGEAPDSLPLGWDPFEEDYPATASAPLNRIATPELERVPTHLAAGAESRGQITQRQPVAAGVIRFTQDGPPPKTPPMAKFSAPQASSSGTAQVAFAPADGESGWSSQPSTSRIPVTTEGPNGTPSPAQKSGPGAASIRFADSEQPTGGSRPDGRLSPVSETSTAADTTSQESHPAVTDPEDKGDSPGWKVVSPGGASWRPTP